MDPLSRGRRLVEMSLAKSRDLLKKTMKSVNNDELQLESPSKRPRTTPVVGSLDRPWPLSSTPIHPSVLNISEIVNELLENDPEFKECSFSLMPADTSIAPLQPVRFEEETEFDAIRDESHIHTEESSRAASQSQLQEHAVDMLGLNNSSPCLSTIPGRAMDGEGNEEMRAVVGMLTRETLVDIDENEPVDPSDEGEKGDEQEIISGRDCVFREEDGNNEDSSRNNEEETCEAEKDGTDINYVVNTKGNELDIEDKDEEMDGGLAFHKRKLGKENWKHNEYKKKREWGVEYRGRSKKTDMIPARTMGGRCSCVKATYQCSDVSDDEREKIFKYVWSLTWEQKKAFVTSVIEKEEVARRTVSLEGDSDQAFKKQKTFNYFLKAAGDQRKRVCRQFFLSTTGLRKWCVRDWVINDRSVGPAQTLRVSSRADDRHFCVEEFFKKLPRLPSHYARASSSKLYLEPLFQSFADVYKMYVLKCKDFDRRPLCRQLVKKIFEDLNLALFRPRKDQCDVCVGYECGTIVEDVWLKHREIKDAAQAAKVSDKEMAINNQSDDDKTLVCTMDLQAVLLTPRIKASSLYYKTKLSVHHFTFYNLVTKDVLGYVWHEGEGGLTANEFASCVVDYLDQNRGYKKYILYSDGCTYQNRNVTLTKALIAYAVKNNVVIEQKILEKGHTQMEVDSVHSCVERNIKNHPIYVPAQYTHLIESARTNPRPYRVKYLQHTFFKDYTRICKVDSIRPGRKVGDPVVTDLRCLLYTPDQQIHFKLSHGLSEIYEPLPRGRNQVIGEITEPTPLYTSRLPIKKEKYMHLQQLKAVMPLDFHSFYDNLPYIM